MYLHLGQNTVIRTDNIIGIFDIDNCTVGKSARKWLEEKERMKKVIYVSYELPKSFIVYRDRTDEYVYICQLSASTLIKRIENGGISI